MLRAALAVVAGFVSLVLGVFVLSSAVYLVIGAERAFTSGTFDMSGLWLGVSIVIGIVAALLGGWVCRTIVGRPRPVIALAGLVLVMGVGQAVVLIANPSESTPRDGAAGVMEAMANTRNPAWFAACNGILGAFGVLVGGGKRVAAQTGAESDG